MAVLAIRQINCVFMALPGESKISRKQLQTARSDPMEGLLFLYTTEQLVINC